MILTSQEATEPAAGGSRSWKGSPWEVGVLSQGAVGPRSVLPLEQIDLVVSATEFPRGKVWVVSGAEGFVLKTLV